MSTTATEELDPDRLSVVEVERTERVPSFAEDVAAGLASEPKSLDPKYFYDDLGSKLFEAICALPEYQVARLEGEIVARHADELVSGLARPVRLVELGSGSATKTRPLISALLARQPTLEYWPIDVSRTALEESCVRLLREYGGLRVRAFAGDYRAAFEQFPPRSDGDAESVLVLFFGSSVGNLLPEEADDLLRTVRGRLRPGDALALGADRVKAVELMIPAYDDAVGVTAAFNKNLLLRINRELGGELDLRAFAHRAVWNEDERRIEMHLVSRTAQRAAIRDLGLEVELAAGEAIVSEVSYKFDDARVARLAERTGFEPRRGWTDEQGHFGVDLLVAV